MSLLIFRIKNFLYMFFSLKLGRTYKIIFGLFLLSMVILGYFQLVAVMEDYWLQMTKWNDVGDVNNVPLSDLPVEAKIRRVFGKDARMALAVSQAENGTRECAKKGYTSNDWGIFQINEVHLHRWTIEQLKDCTQNVLIAYEIFKSSGWHPWVAYQNKSYLRFLND